MSTDAPPPSLDPRARELLAAYREHEPPLELRERVWSRLEGSADAPAPSNPIPRVLGVALGLAAGVVLVFWVVAAVDREVFAPRSRDAAMQAQDDERGGPPARSVRDVHAAPRSRGPSSPPPSTVSGAAATSAVSDHRGAASSPEKTTARRAPPTRRADATSARPGPQLAEEQAVLERGWTALREGQGERALAEAEAHERRFPGGVLEPEREALRVAARCQRSPARATRDELLAAFTRAQPRSPLLARVRAACARD